VIYAEGSLCASPHSNTLVEDSAPMSWPARVVEGTDDWNDPPDGVYSFRTCQTVGDQEHWYYNCSLDFFNSELYTVRREAGQEAHHEPAGMVCDGTSRAAAHISGWLNSTRHLHLWAGNDSTCGDGCPFVVYNFGAAVK
jgi:hypothetical protein